MRILHDNVLLLPDEIVEETPGGIILSDYSKKTPNTATVMGVGKRVKDLKKGDRVIFLKVPVVYWGEKMFFTKREDIYAKVA